jgi:hypothetical protein
MFDFPITRDAVQLPVQYLIRKAIFLSQIANPSRCNGNIFSGHSLTFKLFVYGDRNTFHFRSKNFQQ